MPMCKVSPGASFCPMLSLIRSIACWRAWFGVCGAGSVRRVSKSGLGLALFVLWHRAREIRRIVALVKLLGFISPGAVDDAPALHGRTR